MLPLPVLLDFIFHCFTRAQRFCSSLFMHLFLVLRPVGDDELLRAGASSSPSSSPGWARETLGTYSLWAGGQLRPFTAAVISLVSPHFIDVDADGRDSLRM